MIVGVLGGGQLGRMLALAGYPLGLRFRFFDPNPDSPAGQLAELIVADYDDHTALDRFADGLDVITYEFENVPVDAANRLATRAPVLPPPLALETAQDRLTEKTFFQRLGIPTPSFAPVSSRADLDSAIERIGLPAVLKTRRLGYDGKGQVVIRTHDTASLDFAASPLRSGRLDDLILEQFINFDRELSIIAVRGCDGAMVFYPLVENHHRDGILRLSLAPAPNLTTQLQTQAESYAKRVMESLGYVGVLAIELFEVNGELLANEFAPRVHNSGHWTIEGAVTSQFENHLRAVTASPLGSTELNGRAAMINLIGSLTESASILSIKGAHLHLYGKAPRANRKLGHITLINPDMKFVETFAKRATSLFS